MNKFPEPSDPDYVKVVGVIQRLLTEIQTGTPLAQADAWILKEHYSEQKLKIKRLSGESLDMDQCYINLALVERPQAGILKDIPKDSTPRSSPFSLTERLNVQTPRERPRIELPELFESRKLPDGKMMEPRRILIRGRAGVGKTTLCKKIIRNFVHDKIWRTLFKRLVWVQLRDLKQLEVPNFNLGGMLEHIFFQQHEDKQSLSDEMLRDIENPKTPPTVFLLDGLDEITEITMEHEFGTPHPGHNFVKSLLNRSNVIITTRPHAAFPPEFQTPDLELDTIGFSTEQVQEYIETVIPDHKDDIQTYLLKNRIMQTLVHIPIQLDALCFTWQSSSKWNDSSKNIPETMTTVYEAMTTALWKKDNERLEKNGFPTIGNSCTSETEPFEATEYNHLGYIAFSGLYSNVVEFQPGYRKAMYWQIKQGEPKFEPKFPFDDTFARLSFLRTSEPSEDPSSRGFHFMHLTFQEYFSARHFVKAWKATQTLRYTELYDGKTESREISCREFFQKHKYAARYNIMWRFVAGLLDAEGESRITSFFEAVESEPVDLLGPTHQRLVMHCLAEVVQSDDIRTKLEEQLSQWLQFECKFRGISVLIREMEFPERAMNLVLERASDEAKITTLNSLDELTSLPLKTIELVTRWLEEQIVSQDLRIATLQLFWAGHGCLPSRTINAIKKCMDDDEPQTRQVADHAFYVQKMHHDQCSLPDKDLQNPVSCLEEEDESTSRAVVAKLKRRSKLPEETMQELVAQLDNQDYITRMAAFEVLQDQQGLPSDILEQISAWLEVQCDHRGTIGGGWRRYHQDVLSDDILLALTRRLKKRDRNIRQKAMRVLQCQLLQPPLRACSDDVFQVIVSWLEDQDKAIRQMAWNVLGPRDELPDGVLKAVVAQIEEADQDFLELARNVLHHQSILSPYILQVIMNWLGGQDGGLRRIALQVPQGSHILPEGVLKAVVAQFETQDGDIQRAALELFIRQGYQQDFPDYILRAIGTQLDDNRDIYVRRAALEALENLGRREAFPDDVLNAVVAQLNGQEKEIQIRALIIFEELGSHRFIPDGVVQAIAAKLEEQDKDIRLVAVHALEALGRWQPFPEDVLRAVEARLEDRDWSSRESALKALRHQSALPESRLQAMVVKRLKDEECHIRCVALDILAERQNLSEDVLEGVAALLGDEIWSVRRDASKVLANQTALSEDMLSAVMARLGDEDSIVRGCAIEVLRSRIKLPGSVLDAMLACTTNPDSSIRSDLMKILQNQSGLSESFLTGVAPWMEDENSGVRREAVKLLGTNRTLPDELLRVVTKRLEDTDHDVRWAVLEALGGQKTLPDTILNSEALYPIWVGRCLEEPLCCYIEDEISYLEFPAGLGKVPLEGQSNKFREEIHKRQRELDMPKWGRQ